ncbi:hypothetical protein BDB00DRAFT_160916 [Zychaea mexicana]|uniref:uncharacterized protein n=1 Tax=Zychaea mexicana TaxID=64656 RepID=UPI0022FDE165|nr:uncharacterized protein BDB00DRAFT_160916 [Zychaea mexicana]KAI9482582.1 hypothetical protein BDB00DRAFT_160916 [Zychaea mexicana]
MQETAILYDPNDSGHIEVRDLLNRCKIPQYLEHFLNEGFDSLKSLCEVSEDDMIAMKVKRGHRRLIQREIATLKGIPRHEPLWISRSGAVANSRSNVPLLSQATTTTSSDSSSTSRQASGGNITSATNSSGRLQQTGNTTATSVSDQQSNKPHHHHRSTIRTIGDLPTNKGSDSSNDDSATTTTMGYQTMLPPKRRYRRHPKPDRNAPVKPPSAYVMFSNDLRAELKQQNLTFAQLAKIAGERWKALSATGKSRYETTATEAKNAYLVSLNQYRQTPEFKRYQEYLSDFRAKHGPYRITGGARKRFKAIGSPGSGSMADSSSNGNSNGLGSSSGSSGGSADGYYYDSNGNDAPEQTKLPNAAADENDDSAVVRGFFIQDENNNKSSNDSWPEDIHDSIASFTTLAFQSSMTTRLQSTTTDPEVTPEPDKVIHDS